MFVLDVYIYISIHALRKECDVGALVTINKRLIFLSTHSVRSATTTRRPFFLPIVIFLSTHSVRSATEEEETEEEVDKISIHALRKECDLLMA